jgi:hypothetical protein
MVKSAEEWLGAGDIDGTRQRSILGLAGFGLRVEASGTKTFKNS